MTKEKQINIEEHMALVNFVLKKYFSYILRTEHYDDYFQEGCIGLVSAAERFDPDKGMVFSTFAVKTIYGRIMRYKRDYECASIPRRYHSIWNEYYRMRHSYSVSEIAKQLEISEVELNKIIRIMLPSSLDFMVQNEDKTTNLSNLIPSNEDVESQAVVNTMLETYPNSKHTYCAKLKALGYTQTEVASHMGITQVSVSRYLSMVKKYLAG